ncbi:hypothetical protein Fleli_2387 [Bernardetia litoralis DSM 6794]|uniref:Uncharacterized protein n=1 Tax=Bernardetia litoralis (strain ATCC 23117 / DSM 6794 / NBRC 15988 / NCIMB 1366 / Fx l1 / Sio-4) TaxID=880071 RepID=I4ALC2_BERLS|nr:hypothetical protein [Bernardetia litoralis]AFM04757.1 hypothetical protein Fleli_2387 [Bernardetia litoralis DSM 6794]
MKENKKEQNSFFKKPIIKILTVQIIILIGLITIDLYVFRGYYTSKIIIQPNSWRNTQNYSCKLTIEQKNNNKYLFKFKNKSIIPSYFLNYRNEKYFQNINDTLFFTYIRKNLFPAYRFDYYNSFDCGTGLGLTSINPFESFEIEKTYNDIIEESYHQDLLKKTDFFHNKVKKSYEDLDYKEIDSLLKKESEIISITDSIEIEYYTIMYSFVSKEEKYTKSNKINVSLKDLLEKYKTEYSEK